MLDVAGFPPLIVQFQKIIGSPLIETEPSVSVVDAPRHGAVGAKAAVGKGRTVTGKTTESLHPNCVVITSVTEYVPAAGYIVDVFVLLEDPGIPPGIDQFHETIGFPAPEVDPSIMFILFPAQGGELVKSAVS